MSPTVDRDGAVTISEKLKFCAMRAAMRTYHNNRCSAFWDNSTSSSSNGRIFTQHFYVISDVGEVQTGNSEQKNNMQCAKSQKQDEKQLRYNITAIS
jgi:hypothetical protein